MREQVSSRDTRAAGSAGLERGRLCGACPSLRERVLTAERSFAAARAGPRHLGTHSRVDKQNSRITRQSWRYDWLSRRPAAWSEEVGVELASCRAPVRPVEEPKTPIS